MNRLPHWKSEFEVLCLRGACAGLTPAVALPAAFVSFAESGAIWPGISLLCAPCRLSRVRCAGSGRFRGAFPLGRCKQIVKRHHPDAAFVERLSPYRLPAPSSWEIRAGKHRRRGGKSYCALKYMPDIFSFSAIGRRKAQQRCACRSQIPQGKRHTRRRSF